MFQVRACLSSGGGPDGNGAGEMLGGTTGGAGGTGLSGIGSFVLVQR
jgi:hypothetical protein